MSAKATGLVWDLECPKQYGNLIFKPHHKYVLVAYADHADHLGKNIFPSVPTVAKKTGFDDRSVQRLTADLETMGFLIEDGMGPRGQNRWKLPYSEGGDKLSPRQFVTGDKPLNPSGDTDSGDNPSGDNLSPELKEPEPIIIDSDLQKNWELLKNSLICNYPKYKGAIRRFSDLCPVSFRDGVFTLGCPDEDTRAWMNDRMKNIVNRMFPALRMEAQVNFIVSAE